MRLNLGTWSKGEIMNTNWNMRKVIEDKIRDRGGYVNAHAHLDRAYTITEKTLAQGDEHLHTKWGLVDEVKRKSSVDEYYERMAYGLEQMMEQGVAVVGTFVDVDEMAKDKVIRAADKLRSEYRDRIELVFINQALKGVLEPKARKWFEMGAEFVDILGGLPAKDKDREEEHLDVVMKMAKKMGKMVHMHVDQLNTAREQETELLVDKTMEHGMEGKVVAVHGISIGAHKKSYRDELYKKMRKAGVMVVACPTAWIDARRTEEMVPSHNAVTPVDEMVPAGVTVALGTDNIADVYKPFTDGDMWTELRFLLECNHYYDVNELVKIATVNGRKVLGI
jgi:cytosine/adenosine deaminase-related metal-dependent hydrolase